MANTNLDITIRAKNLADRAFARLGNQIRRVQALAVKLGRIIKRAMIITAAAVAALSIAIIKLGMDAVESENLFKESFGGMADAAREWSEELSSALGLNAFKVRRQAGTIYVMAESMGVAKEEAYDMAKSLTQLAYDMASFYNLKPEDAFLKLQSGISGEAEPLKRLGILVLENTIKQTDYARAILATGRQMTESEKVLARYHAIMEQTAKAQGDLARPADSPANRLRRIKEQVIGLLTKMGILIVTSDAFASALVRVSNWIDRIVKSGKMEEWTQRGIEGFEKFVKTVREGWQTVMASFEEPTFLPDIFKGLGQILWDSLAGAWHAWSAMVRGSVDYIFKPIFLAFRRQWYDMLQEISDTMKDIPGLKFAAWNLQTRATEGKTSLIEEKIRMQQGGESDIERAKTAGSAIFKEEMDKAYERWAKIPQVWSAMVTKAEGINQEVAQKREAERLLPPLMRRLSDIDAKIARDLGRFSRGEISEKTTDKMLGRYVAQRERTEQRIGSIDNSISVELKIENLAGSEKEADRLAAIIGKEIEKAQKKQDTLFERRAKRDMATGGALAFQR